MLYIIQPKSNPMDAVSLKEVQVTQEFRNRQIQKFTKMWKEDTGYQKIREWVKNAKENKTIQAAASFDSPGISGTVVVDVQDDEAAAKMQGELYSYADIVRDEQMHLIEPDRKAAAPKNELQAEDLWHLEKIGLLQARREGFALTGKGVTIAVLDTGIDGSHPELRNKVVKSYNMDAKILGRLGDPDEMPQSQDTDGHGTHVAGLICGTNVGVSPNARLINGIIIPNNIGSLASFEMAMQWISKRSDIDIVNISAGLRSSSGMKVLEQRVQDLRLVGILVVCAIGNEGSDHTRTPGNCRSVVSVGASTSGSRVASFSGSGTIVFENHQYTVPNLVAPGEAVYSSVMGGQYEKWNGTSMAAPIVSGVAALIIEQQRNSGVILPVTKLTEILLDGCRPLANIPKERQGAGLVHIP